MIALSVVLEDERSRPDVAYGYDLPRHFEELDRIAQRLHVTPLSTFVREDPQLYEEALEHVGPELAGELRARAEQARSQPEWHDSGRALETVRALRAELKSRPGLDGVLFDLETVERLLSAGRRFHFDVS